MFATTNTYDNWGRVTDVQAADNTHTKMAYDLNGNIVSVTDANNHTVSNTYDADDRLIQTIKGNGDTVTYTYDGTDHVSGVPQKGLLSYKTDGNNHTTYYSYTPRNEPAATYYPDGTHESVTYDKNGNTLTRTKADGNVISYKYDADNRLTDITYPHLHATHFDYDAAGRKTHMSDATGDTYWDYTYEGLHLNKLTTPQGAIGYAYDGDGRLSIRNLLGTGSWYYSYDPAGRLLSLQSPTDGTTSFSYDSANRLTQKVKGSGDYETYAYDAANQVTGIGFWWYGGTMQNSLTYSYDPAGNVSTMNQGFYATSYGYDGADQLVSETSSGPYPPPALGFTYDHNGNRLAQSSGGSVIQSFTYDAHDKLTSGTANNETDGYDLNGSETTVTIGGGTYHFAWDDEDRMVSLTPPGTSVPQDTFTYNGLGLRVGKTDSTGTYAYICDGTTPGSPVLSDGHTLYTPGLSENKGGTSLYYANDRLGNLWTENGNGGHSQLGYEDFNGFGEITARGGGVAVFGYGGGNGCQTDADTGIVLMGHRYYDSRIGRFLSQDPAGDGDNWYSYADNSPVNETDPLGLYVFVDPTMGGTLGDPSQFAPPGSMTGDGTWDQYQSNGNGGWVYLNTVVHGGLWDSMNNPMSGGSPGTGMIAGFSPGDGHTYHQTGSLNEHGNHVHQGSKNGPRFNRDGKHIDARGNEIKNSKKSIPRRYRKAFQEGFDREVGAGEGAAGEGALGEGAAEGAAAAGAEGAVDLLGPAGMVIGAGIATYEWFHNPESRRFTLLVPGPGYPM